nr:siderophore-interacting protein [Pseudaestuariivita rosea]
MPGLMRIQLKLNAPLGVRGLHVKLLLPPSGRHPRWPELDEDGLMIWPQGEDTLHARTYTIRAEQEDGYLVDVDVVQHQHGHVSHWVETAEIGATVGLLGPGGSWYPQKTGDFIMAGDMTALPVMMRIFEVLPNAQFRAWAACPSQADADSYFGPGRVIALCPDNFPSTIADILARQSQPDVAWFAGEFQQAQTVRAVFKNQWGLGKGEQLAVAYWRKR